MIEAVYAANPKTVVVLMNAGPLSTKWARDNVPAMLEAWYAGEEGGNAIADVLLGDFNPGGRLPYTVYESANDVPPDTDYDITHGYTYMYFDKEPVFPVRPWAELHEFQLRCAEGLIGKRKGDGTSSRSRWRSPTPARAPAMRSCSSTATSVSAASSSRTRS